ncbi:uncharacterized protein LOC144637673 isoform X2 [Oculina patagonica]
MAAAKAARRNTFMHLPNDPFQDPRIGRRTGVPLNIKARKDSHGFDNIDDYFPDSDPEEENVVPNTQSTDEDPLVGRKTVTVSPRKDSQELENVDDDECPDSGVTKPKELSPDEVESPDTPEGRDESPNDTGTAIKNPASREPTPQLKGPIKKRLSFTNGKSPSESEDSQVQSRDSPRDKTTEPISEEPVESDTEIDVVDVTNDSQLITQETRNRSPVVKTTEKAKKQQRTHTRNTKNHIEEDDDDEVIDVEEIEEEETFLTIGNNTMRNVKSSSAVEKSPLSSQADSFIMSESFVLEGTKHKTMSPEFGSSSDSQTEPDPRAKKSKIPVRKKGLPSSKPLQQRVTRGRKKKNVEEAGTVEQEEAQADEKEDDEETDLSNTKQDQIKSTRGRKKKVVEKAGFVEQEEAQDDEKKDDEETDLSNTKREQVKSTRGRKRKAEKVKPDESEVVGETEALEQEEAHADEEDEEERDVSNTKQEQIKTTRGRRQKAEKVKPNESDVVEEPETVEEEEAHADEEEDEERDVSNTKQDQVKSTSGRRQKAEKAKPVVSEVVEVEQKGDETKVKRRAKSLPGKQQRQQKSTSRVERKEDKSKVVASDDDDEEDDDDEGTTEDIAHKVNTDDIAHEGDTVDIAHEKGRRRGRKSAPVTTQQLTKAPRGKKQKKDTENVEDEGVEQNNEDSDNKKPSGRRTRAKKGAESGKNAEQSKSVARGSEQPDDNNPSELSGRKTRAQRKKAEDAKLDKGDGKEGDIDGGRKDVEVVTDDLEIEDVETEKEKEDFGKDDKVSRAQRKEKAKKDIKGRDEVGNEVDLTQIKSKRGNRKSQSAMTEKTVEEEEGQDLSEEVEAEAQVRGGKRGRGRKSQVKEGKQKEKSNDLDTVDELTNTQNDTEEQISSNEHEKTANDASVNNISNVTSSASSGSESSRKVGNGLRRKGKKRSRVLPPYAFKRRLSKPNSSKNSTATSSRDSLTESELSVDTKKRRLHDEGNETNIAEKSSKKGATTNARKTGRAKQTGRRSKGATKSAAQGSETEHSKGTHGLSGVAVETADNNDGVIDDADSVVDEVSVNDSLQEATGVGDSSFEEAPHSTGKVAPAEPVTALKSILKSGGSVGRAATVSRKRVMTSDKSHSGGSDADDESVLPAKQPNRKRLSTVSFASTPFVQGSLSVPANRTPAGLSFVSKDSSYRSTDDTFTPGSARTVRSSVGSAGGSSAGESVIDPEEEITITNDAGQLEDTSDEQNTRRSKRTIVPPLQYWKNERIDYERRKSGGWCIKGIIKNPTPTPKHKRKPKQTKKPVVSKERNGNAVDSTEEEFEHDLEGFQEIINPSGTVLNPENNEQVEMDIFHLPGMLNFTNPSGKPAQDDDPLIVHKFISQPLFGGGHVVLRPGAEKGRQFVRNDTMVFYVIKGRVMVTVHQSSAVLHTGSTFFVPQGNSYNIKNLKKTDAELMFVQIKG